MLVLSRRLKEKVVLPGLGITVRVLAVRGGTVSLGIEAPPDIAVLRDELVGKPERYADSRVAEPCAR
jgi:carbon storage regulator CsrA